MTRLAVFLAAMPCAGPALAQDDAACLGCHADKTELARTWKEGKRPLEALLLDAGRYQRSVHAAKGCGECHFDHDTQPHSKEAETATCGECHEERAKQHAASLHGKALERGDTMAPACRDCHSTHDVLSHRDPRSLTAVLNIHQLCGTCHHEGSPVSRTHQIARDRIFENYSESIHGEGLCKNGLSVTAVCTSCHQDIVTDGTTQQNHSRHAAGSEANRCTSCHLPLTAKSAISYDIRAHTFNIIWPVTSGAVEAAGKTPTPDSCMTGGCHSTAEGALGPWAPADPAANTAATGAMGDLWGDIRPHAIARVSNGGGDSDRTATFTTPVTATLDGSRSFDPNGGAIAGYDWSILSAPGTSTAKLSSRLVAKPTIDLTVPGTDTFVLEVRDARQTSEAQMVAITVN